jgi:hypothetical protein
MSGRTTPEAPGARRVRIDKTKPDRETVAIDDAGIGGSGEGTDVGDRHTRDEHIAMLGLRRCRQ